MVAEETDQRLHEVDAYFAGDAAELVAGDPPVLTRKEKQRRKGLPELSHIRELARTWVATASELWPALAKTGCIAPADSPAIDQLASSFQRRFLEGKPDKFRHDACAPTWTALAAAYLRYSDDNSNPLSLNDQLRKAMRRAKDDRRFIPWEYVFADASVTGRTHLRRGYVLAKAALAEARDFGIDTLYLDDFGRATRDAVESYRLAKLMERLRLRLIGVSDGFDLHSPAAEVQLMAMAMFNRLFIQQLRQKVMRGMKGAAERGTSVGKVRFGYELAPLVRNGKLVMNEGKNTPIRVPKIRSDQMQWVIKAAKWFGEDFKPYKWIARQFNAARVGGTTGWSGSHISKMLACPIYIGVCIYNRTRTVFDEETGRIVIERNPRRDWVVQVVPELRAWPDTLWKKVRRRAAFVRRVAPGTGKQYRTRDAYPAALLLGVLKCGSCGREMNLIRSETATDYRQYGCPSGCDHVNGCQYHSSKSARIVEAAVIRWVNDQILSPERVQELVVKANKFIEEEARRPKVSLEPFKRRLKALDSQERRVMDIVIKHQGPHDVAAYLSKGDELRKQIATVRKQLNDAVAANAEPPPPIDAKELIRHLSDLRALLSSNLEKSAALLRDLVGEIVVHEHQQPGKKRKEWTGEIHGNVIGFLASATRELDYPGQKTWEFLRVRKWIMPEKAVVRVAHFQKQEELAHDDEFRAHLAAGRNRHQIARLMNKPYELVVAAERFHRTGEKTPSKPSGRRRIKSPLVCNATCKNGAIICRARGRSALLTPEVGARSGQR